MSNINEFLLSHVHLATIEDAHALFCIIHQFKEFLKQDAPSSSELLNAVETALLDASIEFLVYVSDNGDFIGYTQTRDYYSLWLPGIETRLEDIFVIPEQRSQGIGSQLLISVISRSKLRHAKLIALNTNERNFASIKLYKKFGFCSERTRWDNGNQLWLEKYLT